MILTFFIWIYVFLLSFIYGNFACGFLNKIIGSKNNDYYNFPLCCIVGSVVICTIAQVYSLFDNVGLVLNCLLLVPALCYLAFNYKTVTTQLNKSFENYKFVDFLWILIVLIIFLFQSSLVKGHFDTNLYLAQAVRWVEEYGTVKGLGNLHDRLAFNCSWLVNQALFGFSFIFKSPMHCLNGWLFFVMFLFLYDSVKNSLLGGFNQYKDNILKILIVVFVAYSYIFKYISSLTTDIPAFFFTCLSLLLFLDFIDKKEPDNSKLPFLIVLLSCFAVTVKLSSMPVLILPLYFLTQKLVKKDWKSSVIIAFISMTALLPYLARNIFLSGYLIFPFPYIDIFNFDWKIPYNDVLTSKKWVTSWAIMPHVNCDTALSLPFNEWFPRWYNRQDFLDKFLFKSIIYLSMINLYMLISNFDNKEYFKKQVVLYLTLYGGFLFWFLNAPAFRFGYGFLIILSSLSIINTITFFDKFYKISFIYKIFSFFYKSIYTSLSKKNYILTVSLIIMIYCCSNLITIINTIHIAKFVSLRPVSYVKFPVKKVKLNNFYVYIPQSNNEGRTGYYFFPATVALRGKEHLIMKGNSMKDGFSINSTGMQEDVRN